MSLSRIFLFTTNLLLLFKIKLLFGGLTNEISAIGFVVETPVLLLLFGFVVIVSELNGSVFGGGLNGLTTFIFSLKTTSSSSSSSSLLDGTVGNRRFGGSVSVVILGFLFIVTLPVSDLVDGIRVIRTSGAAAFNVDDVTDGLRIGKACLKFKFVGIVLKTDFIIRY